MTESAFEHAPLTKLRAILLLLLGMPVCAMLFSGALVFIGNDLVKGIPIETVDWFGAAAFGLGSLAVLVIALRAWLRTRAGGSQGSEFAWIARIAPFLIVVGLVLGPIAMRSILEGRDQGREELVRMLCQEYLGYDSSLPLDDCLPTARTCKQESRAVPFSNRGIAERQCMRTKLGPPPTPIITQ